MRTTASAVVLEGRDDVPPDDDAVVAITTKAQRKRTVTRRIRDCETAATRSRETRGYPITLE
jgi:hypothetical protein